VLGVCLAPQMMHLVAWETTMIWTYSILSSFLVLWVDAEVFAARSDLSQFLRLLCLAALVLNISGLTPLMDGRTDNLDLTTRVLLYAPVIGAALDLILWEGTYRSGNGFPFKDDSGTDNAARYTSVGRRRSARTGLHRLLHIPTAPPCSSSSATRRHGSSRCSSC